MINLKELRKLNLVKFTKTGEIIIVRGIGEHFIRGCIVENGLYETQPTFRLNNNADLRLRTIIYYSDTWRYKIGRSSIKFNLFTILFIFRNNKNYKRNI